MLFQEQDSSLLCSFAAVELFTNGDGISVNIYTTILKKYF